MNGGEPQPAVGVDERTLRLSVPGMDCASCAEKVGHALSRHDGVAGFEVLPATGRVIVTFDPASTSSDAVSAAIEGAGYAVRSTEDAHDQPPEAVFRSRRALLTGAGGFLLLTGILLSALFSSHDALVGTFVGRAFRLSHLLFLASIVTAGTPILRNGYYSARTRSLDIDFLMSVGILGAVFAHLPFEGATLAVLFGVAQVLERFSMDRARHSLRELMALSPDTATVLRDGRETTVPVEAVHVGDEVAVRPGEQIPMDGRVTVGASAVNQAPITGESVPVDKEVGDEVYAGTINEEGYLECRVEREADESTLSRIVELVADAQSGTTKREQFVDRFARYYTPLVVIGALLTFLVPPLFFGAPWRTWYLRGLTLLVISCPCAFVISTPVSVVSGITSAARNGVLIKGGNHLEAMGEVDVVAFDKTGTLTTGELTVTDVLPLNGTSEDELLRLARALEQRSEHPIAQAIVTHAALDERSDTGHEEQSTAAAAVIGNHEVTNFESLTGKGVRADLDGVTHYAGRPDLFAALGFDLEHTHATTDGGREVLADSAVDDAANASLESCEMGSCLDLVTETLPRLEREGKTIVLVGSAERLVGVIAIADDVRPGARETVARLHELGIETVMLTGDNEGTARTIADRVGVETAHAELLPEEKVALIDDLAAANEGVAMVGDGINDAPALATATVGIAMGAAGTDTALETADVALMGDDLSRLPYLIVLSRRANGVIRGNIWSSLAVKALLAIGAPFGLVTVVHAVVIGDVGMSLAVTGNAMRLARVRPDEP